MNTPHAAAADPKLNIAIDDPRITHVLDRYHELIRAEHDGRSRGVDEHGRDARLRAVGPASGQLLNLLARGLVRPTILELGTSYGYSAIWLAEAARATGGRVITMELDDYKSAFAREMAEEAGLAAQIDFQVGDAVALIEALPAGIDFVLVDLWKDLYVPCLEAFFPKLNTGAIIVADNMIRPGNEDVRRYGRAVRAKPGIASVLLTVGAGLEVSRLEA